MMIMLKTNEIKAVYCQLMWWYLMSPLAVDACLSWSLPSITEQQVPSQASYAVLAEESQAFLKLSQHTDSISNPAILRNNYISLLSDLCACVHMKKNGVIKEVIVLRWAVQIASRDFKLGKKRWAGALLSEKCCFVQKTIVSHANLN